MSLNNLAILYNAQGRYEEAEPLLNRALTIVDQQFGREHLTTLKFRKNYVTLRQTMERDKKRRRWKWVFGLFSK